MFFRGTQRRNFNGGNGGPRANPYNQNRRGPVRRAPAPKPRRQRNDPNMANKSERVETFKVYAGALESKGLAIPIGPDPKMFSTTSFVTTALNYNNYRPLAVSLEYTPLVNQTQAISMINAYLTTDTAALIPTTDILMKNSTVCHRGAEWFAANRVTKKFEIPILKQNTYETGSGDVEQGNTPYENAAQIIVKPTSVGEAKAFGELFIVIRVAFSSPATPIIGKPSTIVEVGGGFKKDVMYKLSEYDEVILEMIFKAKYAKYMSVDYNAAGNTRAQNSWFTCLDDTDAFDDMLGVGKVHFMFTDTHISGDVYFVWGKSEGGDEMGWQKVATSAVQLVAQTTPVVTADAVTLRTAPSAISAKDIMDIIQMYASSIPTHNKITEDTDNTKVEVQDQPILVNIEKLPLDVNVVNEVLDVNVTNDELDVNITNKEVPIDVKNQPIDVHQVKDVGETILDLIGSLVGLVMRDADGNEIVVPSNPESA